jgi:hypothetical protein
MRSGARLAAALFVVLKAVIPFSVAHAQGASASGATDQLRSDTTAVTLATNCVALSGTGESRKFIATKQATMVLYAFPDGNSLSSPVQVAAGESLLQFPFAPENTFRCVKIGARDVRGWIVRADLENAFAVHEEPATFDSQIQKLAQCSSSQPTGQFVTGSIERLSIVLGKYSGCEKRPEMSFVITEQNHFEVHNRLMSVLMDSKDKTCASFIADLIGALGRKMEQLRATFPSCGKARSREPIDLEITAPPGLNVRDFWIEGASSSVKATLPVGTRVKLYDLVGNWGYFTFRPQQADGANSGWMNVRYTNYKGDTLLGPAQRQTGNKRPK